MSIPNSERFAYYVQAAVAQGAFLKVGDLLDRFLRAIGSDVGERQRKRYYHAVEGHAEAFGLTLFRYFESNRALYVKSARGSLHIDYEEQYDPWLVALLHQLESAPDGVLRVYEILRKITDKSQATLERLVSRLKNIASKLSIEFFDWGRFLCIRRAKKPCQNTPHQGDIPYYREKAKDINPNSTVDETPFSSTIKKGPSLMKNKKTPYVIRKKASIIAQELKWIFYDNIKVKYNANMAYKYVEGALLEGFREQDIQQSFDNALIQRHKDATDEGLNTGSPTLQYELSSTVSLARTILKNNLQEGKIAKWTPEEKKKYPPRSQPKRFPQPKRQDTANAEFGEISPKKDDTRNIIHEVLAENTDLDRARQRLKKESAPEAIQLQILIKNYTPIQYVLFRRRSLKKFELNHKTSSINAF